MAGDGAARPMVATLEQAPLELPQLVRLIGNVLRCKLEPDLMNRRLSSASDLVAFLADDRHCVDDVEQPLREAVDLRSRRGSPCEDPEVDRDLEPGALTRGRDECETRLQRMHDDIFSYSRRAAVAL